MKKSKELDSIGYGTKCVHAGLSPNKLTGAILDPISQCAVYAQSSPGEFSYDYGRSMNPNYYPLEEALAALEFGKHAAVVASGVSAMSAVLGMLKSGDRVVTCTDMYGGTYRLFKQIFEKFGLSFSPVDCKDLNQVEDALRLKPKMLYIESPTNPLLEIYDLASIAAIAQKNNVITCIDNTFASPYFQNPLTLGWDIVIHSTTKYIGGHSDIVGGVVVTNNKEYRDQADFNRKAMGLHPDPFTMFLMRRSIKTLPLRMERHQQNAMKIAQYLEQHPKVARVLYPGLESHPQHQLANKQMRGYGGMMSVFFKLPLDSVKKLVSSFEIITLAESLGAVESLVQLPSAMSHQKIPADVRERHGLTEGLARFSIGIEDVDDLISDFDRALLAAA